MVTTSALGVIVTMDGTQVLNYPTTLPQYVLVGFTGGTGGFNDMQQVQNVSISSGAPAPTPDRHECLSELGSEHRSHLRHHHRHQLPAASAG